MAYTAPTTRSTSDLITASIWNTDMVDNIAFLAGFGVNGTAFSGLTAFTDITRISVGTYTGDGNTTQAITGVGFQPQVVVIYGHTNAYEMVVKSDQDSTSSFRIGTSQFLTDLIISLDSDGFTVGDATSGGSNPNANTIVFTYIALR